MITNHIICMALASYAMYVTMNAPDGNLVQTAVTEE